MYRRSNRLFFIALSAIILAVIAGCSQPNDVLAPVASTKIVLRPERLPTLPQGMIYELWIQKSNDQIISLGKFNWNNHLYRFYDPNGNPRDSLWEVNFDLLKAKRIMISVENNPDPQPSVMGPLMLADTLIDPAKRPLKMIFPRDLWLSTIEYSITSPTDGDSYAGQSSGLWFAQYTFKEVNWWDTTRVFFKPLPGTKIRLQIDTIWDNSTPPQIIRVDTINLPDLKSRMIWTGITNIHADTNFRYIPDKVRTVIDSLILIRQIYDRVEHHLNTTPDTIIYTDTIREVGKPDSIYTYVMAPFTDYASNTVGFDLRPRLDTLDQFLGPIGDTTTLDPILDLRGTGWHYKGWAISPYVPTTAGFPKITKPAWLGATTDYVMNPTNGGMLTTGTFNNFHGPDNGNPYSQTKRVPPYPGEDFLNNLPGTVGARGIYLADSANPTVQAGTAFITLEPDNFNSDSTNFPLVLFTSEGRLPSWERITIIPDRPSPPNEFRKEFHFYMNNWASSVNNNTAGFPAVHVDLQRQ